MIPVLAMTEYWAVHRITVLPGTWEEQEVPLNWYGAEMVYLLDYLELQVLNIWVRKMGPLIEELMLVQYRVMMMILHQRELQIQDYLLHYLNWIRIILKDYIMPVLKNYTEQLLLLQ